MNKTELTETKRDKLYSQHEIEQVFAAVCRRYNIYCGRAVNKSDYYRICKGENIGVLKQSASESYEITGVYLHTKNSTIPFIFVNPRLVGDSFLYVAFHELGHHFLHREQKMYKQFFHRRTKRYLRLEDEANFFAELALKRKVEVKSDEN